LLKTSYLQIDRSHALLERKRDGEIKKSTSLSLLHLVSLLRMSCGMSDPSRRRPASWCDHVRPAKNVQQRRWSMSLTHLHVIKRKARLPAVAGITTRPPPPAAGAVQPRRPAISLPKLVKNRHVSPAPYRHACSVTLLFLALVGSSFILAADQIRCHESDEQERKSNIDPCISYK